jgi:hypothetical protein
MLRWFRLPWLLGTGWEQATESEVAVLTGWLRSAANPQRQRYRCSSCRDGQFQYGQGVFE